MKKLSLKSTLALLLVLACTVGCENPLADSSEVENQFVPGLNEETENPAAPSETNSTLTVGTASLPADSISSTIITATLKNSAGEPVVGATVAFAATGTGNTLVQPTAVTDAAGKATGTLKSGTAETKVISLATPTGIGLATNVVFTALTPVSGNWNLTLANASNYTAAAPSMEFSSSAFGHKSLTLDSTNDSPYGFGAIQNSNLVEWSSSAMQLTAAGMTAGSGSFESRVFAAPAATSWTQLKWTSARPAAKSYPDNKGVETGYASGNIDMSDNVLLLHMDDASWAGADAVKDSSGSGHHGTIVSNPAPTATGKFGNAGSFTTNGSYITIPHSADFDSTSQMTIEAWLYPTTVDTNPRGIISKRNGICPGECAFSLFSNAGGSRVYFDIAPSMTTSNRYDSGFALTANTWQHLVVVFDGTLPSASNSRLKFYLNGVLKNSMDADASMQATSATAPLFVAGLPGNTTKTFLGRMDEIAIYRRPLTLSEITDRYQRGRVRLKLQARACSSSDCSDGTYVGPDGLSSSYFTEGSNTSILPETTHSLTGFTGKQYFQYKVLLENDDTSLTPLLKSVNVLPNIYDAGYPTIINNTGTAYRNLNSFSATTGGSGSVRFQISNGTNWYYWNGSNWGLATAGFSHTNDKQTVADHISTFPYDAGTGSFSFKAFFDSGATATNPATLSNVSISGGQ